MTDWTTDGKPGGAVFGVPEFHDAGSVGRQDAKAVRHHEHVRYGAAMLLSQSRCGDHVFTSSK